MTSTKADLIEVNLAGRGYVTCHAVREATNGSRIAVAGLVLVRQMPGSAKGVMFITLEDETANANLIVWPSVFDQNRRTILKLAKESLVTYRAAQRRKRTSVGVVANEQ